MASPQVSESSPSPAGEHPDAVVSGKEEASKMRAIYIAGTHWDREWYEPFQEYRFWLVQVMDRLLDRLATDRDYRIFHLDGQAVMIEDYLRIQPSRKAELTRFLSEGRLVAGPWYVMPDLWLVSGEALIRNFQRGRKIVREMGGVPGRVGYAPDLFGHIAAMPMIYRGFGIPYCVLWRGVNDEQVPAVFEWVGPDEVTSVVTHHLPDDKGYGWWSGNVRWPWVNASLDPEVLRDKVTEAIRAEVKRTGGLPVLYLSDAADHQFAPAEAPDIARLSGELIPGLEIVMGSMEEYFEEVTRVAGPLERVRGEFRHPARDPRAFYHALIPHCLSSRPALKAANDRCQNLLTRWAEPLLAMRGEAGARVPEGFLDLAWEYLLLNQPHDSICGCSIDATHADMPYRFRQCEHLAEGIRRQCLAPVLSPTVEPAQAPRLAVWNPLPWDRSGVQEVEIYFPPEHPSRVLRSGHNPPCVNQFRIVDAGGTELRWQLLSLEPSRLVKGMDGDGRRVLMPGPMDVYRVAVDMDLPQSGCGLLRIEPILDAIERPSGSQRTAPAAASNGILSVTVDPSGAVDLELDGTGVGFSGLFLYEDSGDTGDGWNFVPPVRNPLLVGHGSPVVVSVEEDGPLQTTFSISRTLHVPAALEPVHREERQAARVAVRVTDHLTLRRGEHFLRVRTVVENTALDHRLRVLFPTRLPAETYWSDQPFAWVERPVAIDAASARYKEPDPQERPHHTAVAIAGTRGGLAVLTPAGIHEHAITDDPSRSLALTLFRGTLRTHQTNGEPGGQSTGELVFEYALVPFAGAVPKARLTRLAMELQTGVFAQACGLEAPPAPWMHMDAPEEIILSACKPAADGRGVVLRFWNTGDRAASALVAMERAPKGVEVCNLDEESVRKLSFDSKGRIQVEVPARGLQTLRIF